MKNRSFPIWFLYGVLTGFLLGIIIGYDTKHAVTHIVEVEPREEESSSNVVDDQQ